MNGDWSFTVVVPFTASGDPARAAALGHVQQHYDYLPVKLLVCDTSERPWSKGAALRDGVRWTDTPGLVIADADCLCSVGALERSMLAVIAGAPWSQPHSTVYRLSRSTSIRLYRGQVQLTDALPASGYDRPPHPAPLGGGIVVCSRAAWDASGGIDPRFVGFGGDDISWARALDTMAGPGVHFDAPLWHCWHRRSLRRPGNRGSVENEELAAQYAEANGDRERMRHVIASRVAA